MPREKIEFAANVPVELALAYATGREGTSTNGQYFLYTTTDERIFFATPTLNTKIQEHTPNALERLVICLRKSKETQNKNVWEVRRLDPKPPAAGQGASNTPTSAQAVQQTNQPSNGNSNGNGNHYTVDGRASFPPTPPTKPAAPSLMNGRLAHFTAAVDLCIAARHYAHLSGLEVEIHFEDIRAVANTLAISADKQGGR